MKKVDRAYSEFLECLHTAITEDDFRRMAERMAHALGFRWFAYLGRQAHGSQLISSYPKKWTDYYFKEGYDQIDPVLQKPRLPSPVVVWDGRDGRTARSSRERRLFDDALSFKIRTGLTIQIPTGQNQCAAFTLAVDDRSLALDRFIESSQDLLKMVAIRFQAHVSAKITVAHSYNEAGAPLTHRQRQCLYWTSDGKTMQDIAQLLGVRPRGVKFHLDNARKSLSAQTLPHAVALALRQGLL